MAEFDPDLSHGWEAVAGRFIALRSQIGAGIVRDWSKALPAGGSVLDLGCGFGEPVSAVLLANGFRVSAIEPSPTLAGEYRRRFPQARLACEPVETSPLFGEAFDGAVAIGLMFLLPPDVQLGLMRRAAGVLRPDGRFLFTAPRQVCTWMDALTGRPSCSLGEDAYARAAAEAGMILAATATDEGGNFHYDAVKL